MKVSREKAALGFFIILTLGGLCLLITYIVTVGHSLNVAASNIDDATGNLDDYTVILYEGTASEHHETVVNESPQLGSELSSYQLNMSSVQDNTEASTDELSADDTTQSSDEEGQSTVSVLELKASYADKGASVFSLDVTNTSRYNVTSVIRTDTHVFGIFSIDEITAQKTYFQKRVSDYELRDVDIIVCLVSDLFLLDSYEGADIVISTQAEGLAANGVSVDGVFYNDAALEGQVGTVLVSSSRTITARDSTSV